MARREHVIGQTQLICADAICCEAIRRYAELVSAEMPLAVTVGEPRETDIVFDDASEQRIVTVQWAGYEEVRDRGLADWEQDWEEDEEDLATEHGAARRDHGLAQAVSAFARTAGELATNRHAADALLERASARPGKTRGTRTGKCRARARGK